MTSLLAKSMGHLANALKRATGITVTYWRGPKSVELTVIPGLTRMEVDNIDGAVTSEVVPDFLIKVIDLVINNEQVTPKRHDRIEWNGRMFELFSVGSSREYDYTDQYRTMYRVHTKEVDPKL